MVGSINVSFQAPRSPGRFLFSVLFSLALTLAGLAQPSDDTWPRFRGHNGAGHGAADLPATWTTSNIAWSVELPATGHGSPVVWKDTVFLLCANEKTGQRIPTALATADGSVRWKKNAAATANRHHKFNSLASTTPAVDAERVIFTWADKRVTAAAYEHDGTVLWRADLGPVKGGHGFGASPILVETDTGPLVTLTLDQDGESSLVGLNATDGSVRWSIPRKSQRLTYSTPVVYQPAGQEPMLVFVNWQHGLTAIDPETGERVWEKSVFDTTTKERAVSSPIAVGDFVYATCGFTTNPKHAVALRSPARGEVEEVWRIEKSVPHIPSLLAVEDRIYLWEDKGIVTCANRFTGEILWKERVRGEVFGSPVRVGDKIFCPTKEGAVNCISAGPAFEILGRSDLGDLCRTAPAIADGALYLRTYNKLFKIQAAP